MSKKISLVLVFIFAASWLHGQTSNSYKQYLAKHETYKLKFIDSYLKQSNYPAALQKEIRSFITYYYTSLKYKIDYDPAELKKRFNQGKNLSKKVSDPLFNHVYGKVHYKATLRKVNWKGKEPRKEIEKTNWPGLLKLVVLSESTPLPMMGNKSQERVDDYAARINKYLIPAIEACPKIEERHFFNHYERIVPYLHFKGGKALIVSLRKNKKASPWLIEMFTAKFLENYRLNYLFKKYPTFLEKQQKVKLARKYYLKAFSINSKYPDPFLQLMHLVRWTGDQPQTLFQKAISVESDNWMAYEKYMYSFPNVEQQAIFAKQCSSLKAIVEVPCTLVHSKFILTRDIDFINKNDFYPHLLKSLLTLIKTDKKNAHTWLTRGILWSIKSGNYQGARRLMAETKTIKLDLFLLEKYKVNPKIDLSYIYAVTNAKSSKLALECRKLIFSKVISEAAITRLKQLIEDAREICDDKRAYPFYDYCQSIADKHSQFKGGKLIKLEVDNGFTNWEKNPSFLHVVKGKGALVIDICTGYDLLLKSKFNIEYPLELNFTMRFHSAPKNQQNYHKRDSTFIGCKIGKYGKGETSHPGRFFWINRERQEAGVSSYKGLAIGSKIQYKWLTKIKLVLAENYYEFYINDKLVAHEFTAAFSPKDELAIGMIDWLKNYYAAEFINMTLKPINIKLPKTSDATAINKFYDEKIKQKKHLHEWSFYKALNLIQLNDYANAVKLLEGSMNKLHDKSLIKMYLAKCYAQLGKLEAAKKHFNGAINKSMSLKAKLMAIQLLAENEKGLKDHLRADKMLKEFKVQVTSQEQTKHPDIQSLESQLSP